jgi:hypothetical protein
MIKTYNLSIDMLPARDQTEIGEKVYIVEMKMMKLLFIVGYQFIWWTTTTSLISSSIV